MTKRTAILAALVSMVQPIHAQTVSSVVSTADLSQAMAPGPARVFARAGSSTRHTDATITVDDRVTFQRMDGFGASITDSAAFLLSRKLSSGAREDVMRMLFDTKVGMGLSFLRQPIGSEDLSRHHFTFDDLPPGGTDPRLKRFALPAEQAEELKLVAEARRLNPALTVMATPWSPPACMKRGGTMNGGTLLPRYEPTYANYLVHAVRSFADAGIPVRYLSVQNEPLNDLAMMASMGMTADQSARFIAEDLGPALHWAGLATRVLALDHSWDQASYAATLLADPPAARFIAGTAFHCYGGRVEAQSAIHASFPAKGIWLTECSGGTWDKEPALIKTVRVLIDATRNWAKAVVLWGVALDQDRGPWDGGCDTCRPLVTIDTASRPGTVTYEPDLYGLGHASRFVPPGAVRIGSTTSGSVKLRNVAFLDKRGRIALVVLNEANSEATFTVEWRGRSVVPTIPPRSVATLVWRR